MANFDKQLSRMEFLMGYRMPVNESKNSNIEYHTNGADGKVYGIVREGTKFYIKTTTPGNEELFESYDYINGFNDRKATEYKSYNEASKQLELRLMSLNEAYGVKNDVSTVDFNRSSKVLSTLTEEARKELNRLTQIMENSVNIGIKNNIGDHGDEESKGTSKGSDTVKNNKPFDEKAIAKLDKDFVEQCHDPKNTDSNYDDAAKNVNADLQSDKMKTGGESKNDYKDAHDDLEGDGVADKKPKGAKSVKLNEGLYDTDNIIDTHMDKADLDEPYDDDDLSVEDFDDNTDMGDEYGDASFGDDPVGAPEEVGTDIVGADSDEDDDLDTLMEEFESIISGDCEAMTGKNGTLDVQTCDRMSETENCKEEGNCACKGKECDGTEDAMTGKSCDCEPITWDKMNESQKKVINTIVESVCGKIFNDKPKKSVTVESKIQSIIDKIVKEEVTKLNAWGKHPKYGKEPMTTPDNKEVIKGTAEKDWNDDSAKGSQRYGQKIGDGAPFDQVVDMLTDSVMKMLKENLGVKKN